MHFGNISNYTNGDGVHKNANGILWRWEVPITRFHIMAQDIFLDNLPKMTENANIDWAMHLKLNWECHYHVQKNGELCLICYSPFEPKGAWILGTCQHMYHSQCLITLMVARRRCSQCRVPFHQHLYEQFNLWMAMPQHWEYNRLETPNRP
jgi:hypothetical protein